MYRIIFALLIALGLSAPAQATELLVLPNITTAVGPAVGQVFQIRPGPGGQFLPDSMLLQGTFVYGSGGTSVDAYVQTSADGMVGWMDVAHFSYTTSSLRNFLNVSSATSIVAAVTASDGGVGGTPLTANTATAGIFGNYFRVKYQTAGVYAGGTTLRIDAIANGLTTLP